MTEKLTITSADSILTALFSDPEDQKRCLDAAKEAGVDTNDIHAAWAFIEEWVEQQLKETE